MITNKQKQMIYAALASSGQKDYKAEMVLGVTLGRTEHTSDMSFHEANALISLLNQGRVPPNVNDDPNNKMRRKIISIFREMNYNHAGKADMERIQNTLKKYWKKELNQYNAKELIAIISVLENQWLPNYYKQKRKGNAKD